MLDFKAIHGNAPKYLINILRLKVATTTLDMPMVLT